MHGHQRVGNGSNTLFLPPKTVAILMLFQGFLHTEDIAKIK